MRIAQKPEDKPQPRTMEQLIQDIFGGLASLQNVLYRKSASQKELQRVWDDTLLLAKAWHDGQGMLGASLSMNADITQQRDAAIKAVTEKRREWIDFAERQGRRVVAAGVTLDKEGIDEAAVRAEHGDNEHAQEYLAALVLVDAHTKLWTPAAEEAKVEPAAVEV